jgi:hypothetical protein
MAMADTNRFDSAGPSTGRAEATGTTGAMEHISRRWLAAVCTAILVALVAAALVVALADNNEGQVSLEPPESSTALLGSAPTAAG